MCLCPPAPSANSSTRCRQCTAGHASTGYRGDPADVGSGWGRPRGRADELDFGVAQKRAVIELQVSTARVIDEGEVFEVRAHFLGNLDYSVQ